MTDELSPSQAAARIGATTRSVQRWIAAGRLPARRVGGRWRVASDALDAFAGQERASPRRDLRSARRDPTPTIRRLFIANRGEIAARIKRTCDRLGIAAIEPRDRRARTRLDLLDIDGRRRGRPRRRRRRRPPGVRVPRRERRVRRGRRSAAGIRWIGPPPDAIRAMGDKAAARQLARRARHPDDRRLRRRRTSPTRPSTRAAKRIGYPILVKPAAGGGGKGMRTVRDRERPRRASSPRRAARPRPPSATTGSSSSASSRAPRHVEVQVLFDGHGHGVHLGERDCSLQRRHQKVLEETPSPAVRPAIRAAPDRRRARPRRAEVGYVSAGTCEFLLDDARRRSSSSR